MKKSVSLRIVACILTMLITLSMMPVLNVFADTSGTIDSDPAYEATADEATADEATTNETTADESDFEYEVNDGEVTITGYTGKAAIAIIPATIDEYPVTSIGDQAFYGCTVLKKVTIPESVKSIGTWAFWGCNSISDIIIPGNAEYIGVAAFEKCTSLKEVIICEGVKTVSIGAFYYTAIESITIPASVTYIGGSFAGCKNLTEITVDENNPVYDSRDNCNAIIKDTTLISGCRTTVIPDDVEIIGNSAFNGMGLESIDIPGNVEFIQSYAFKDCNFAEVDIPDSVEYIYDGAFMNCTALKSVEIPAGVSHISGNPFRGCTNLVEITVDENNLFYDSRDNCNAIIDRYYMDMVLVSGCRTTVIPEDVREIGYQAFDNHTEITSIPIPQNITSIDWSAFYGCSSLADVYYTGTRNQWDAIEIAEYGNENFINAAIHFMNSSDEIADELGHSITLSGNIGVNFFLELSEAVLADGDAKVEFTYADTTVEVPVSEGVKTENGCKFTCEVPAKDMASQVYCRVKSSLGYSKRFIYSVQNYAEIILANPDTYGEKAVELVKSMLNYGTAAQEYFGYNTGSLANDTEYMTDEDRIVAEKDFSNLSYTLTKGSGDVTYYGTALSLKSEVAIKHYFTLAEDADVDSLTVMVNGEDAKLVKSGDLYQLTISDIPAHKLYNDYVVEVGDLSLSYCAMDYAAVAQQTGDAALMKVMYALDAYTQNAQAYQN